MGHQRVFYAALVTHRRGRVWGTPRCALGVGLASLRERFHKRTRDPAAPRGSSRPVSTQTSPFQAADPRVGAGPVGSAYAGSATVLALGTGRAHAP